jgi:hypothetical protein
LLMHTADGPPECDVVTDDIEAAFVIDHFQWMQKFKIKTNGSISV